MTDAKLCVHCGLFPTIDEWGSMCTRCFGTVKNRNASDPHWRGCGCWIWALHNRRKVVQVVYR